VLAVTAIAATKKSVNMSIASMRFTIFHLLPFLLAFPFPKNKTGHLQGLY